MAQLRNGAWLGALMIATGGATAADPAIFETPEAAAEAVVAALDAGDRDALIAVFGPENEDVILSDDESEDRETWREFLQAYRTAHRIDRTGEGAATLSIGRDLWPFPPPLVADAAGWRFDAAAAREEMLVLRIGRNELDVIDLLHGYVDAQAAYRALDPDGDGLPAFAASLLSTAGMRDGLYWPDTPDGPESPVGDFMARAAAEGYVVEGGADAEPEPYLGYYYRILTKQGPAAPGGAMDFEVNEHLVAGHALLAFPAAYGDTGVMSFVVGERGVVYEADLGEETLDRAAAIDTFDPGEGWVAVQESTE